MKFDDVKKEEFIIGLLAILFLIAPGLAFIYRFYPSLISELDWIKLVLLSVSLDFPATIICMILLILTLIKSKDGFEPSHLFLTFSLSIIGGGIIIYLLIFADFLKLLPTNLL